MAYQPQFAITPGLLAQVEALEEGCELATSGERARREVVNYFAGLRYVEKRAALKQKKKKRLTPFVSTYIPFPTSVSTDIFL